MPAAAPTTNRWVLGARPRTLPASAVPVVVGVGAAIAHGGVVWWRAVVALVVALALQVGTNFANDYSDGVRGTDTDRVGPTRLVASGLASPGAVKRAALAGFAVAALAGLALAATAGWWLVAVGAGCIAAGWGYTGGPRPYGYIGLGEVFVFVCFGLVATAGTTFVATGALTPLAVAAAVPVGLLSVALLVVNNLRDIPGDTVAGKRTLAVRLGDARTRRLYVACTLEPYAVAVAIAVTGRPLALLAVLSAPLAARAGRAVLDGASGRDLVPVLGRTAQLLLVFGVALAVGLAV